MACPPGTAHPPAQPSGRYVPGRHPSQEGLVERYYLRLEDSPAVGDLAGDDTPRQGGGGDKVVGPAVLLAPEQDVARGRTLYASQEAPLNVLHWLTRLLG